MIHSLEREIESLEAIIEELHKNRIFDHFRLQPEVEFSTKRCAMKSSTGVRSQTEVIHTLSPLKLRFKRPWTDLSIWRRRQSFSWRRTG